MENIQILNYIITGFSSVGGFLLAKKYLWEYIVKFFEWLFQVKRNFDEQNVNASKELLEIKEDTNNVYENQIQFLSDQVKSFEDRINFKQAELNKYLDELHILRQKLIDLQKQLYENQVEIAKLKTMYCGNIGCPHRVTCMEKR